MTKPVNTLTLILDPRTNTYVPAKVSQQHNDRQVRQRVSNADCPDWIFDKFKSHRPKYVFHGGPKEVAFQGVEWWYDTREWVGKYGANVYDVNTGAKSTERYVFALRDGIPIQLRQFGTNPWRSQA